MRCVEIFLRVCFGGFAGLDAKYKAPGYGARKEHA